MGGTEKMQDISNNTVSKVPFNILEAIVLNKRDGIIMVFRTLEVKWMSKPFLKRRSKHDLGDMV